MKKIFPWLIVIVCIAFFSNWLLKFNVKSDKERFKELYPLLKVQDSVCAIVTFVDDGRNYGLRKAFGAPLRADSIGFYADVQRDLEYGTYFFQYIRVGDSILKDSGNDTVYLKKGDETLSFLLR